MSFSGRSTLFLQVTSIALALSSGIAMALPSYSGDLAGGNFSGFFANIGLGAHNMSYKTTVSETSSQPATTTPTLTGKKKDTVSAGNVNFGYGTIIDPGVYIGGRLGILLGGSSSKQTFTNAGKNATDTNLTSKIHHSETFTGTLDALVGVMLGKVLFYASAGAGLTSHKITVKCSNCGTDSTNAGEYNDFQSKNKSKGMGLWRLGLGVKYSIAQNFNLSLDLIHTSGKKVTSTYTYKDATDSTDPDYTYTGTVNAKPSYNTLMLGLEIVCNDLAC